MEEKNREESFGEAESRYEEITKIKEANVLLNCKVILCGEEKCGKTMILESFESKKDLGKISGYDMTTFFECRKGFVNLEKARVNFVTIEFPGQKAFGSIFESLQSEDADVFIADANFVFYIYDITNRKSFELLPKWMKLMQTKCKNSKGIVIANKCDLQEFAEVSNTEAMEFSKKHGMEFFQCDTLSYSSSLPVFKKVGSFFMEAHVT
eukprot:snap_masked-scaffold_6-processed-gene-4.44-mRNA-1 protein AED:1.00 eAED:1.00 QI:0/-1/0/0/-1/1/1/0/208